MSTEEEKHVNQALYNQAIGSLTPEQIAQYKKTGEEMYNTVDFNTSQIINSEPLFMESIAYITESLKSGLHPSCLSKTEIEVMQQAYGADWFIQFGYKDMNL